jgi:hypothetical protein
MTHKNKDEEIPMKLNYKAFFLAISVPPFNPFAHK